MRFKAISFLLTISAYAKPAGVVPVNGTVSLSQNGKEMIIECSDKSILHWDSFHIDQDEAVRFLQQSSASSVLNRVMSQASSQILGALLSNGQVYLINPNGVFIGPNAEVMCAGFLASTFDVLDEDFLKGGELLFSGNSEASITNEGTIIADSGAAVLIGQNVDNKGTLKGDFAGIASGAQVLFRPGSHQKIYIAAPLSQERSYASAINLSGLVEAKDITIKGEEVRLASGASIDASMPLQGGAIDVESTRETVVEQGASLTAHALEKGDGGSVMVWSDGITRFSGFAGATGGPESGNGGKMEISGKGGLGYDGEVNLRAPRGRTGKLLFDPHNATIQAGGVDPATGNTFGTNPALDVVIDGAALGAAIDAASVTIQANNDIFVNDTVTATTNGNGLALQAGRVIRFSAIGQVQLNNGDFSALINDSGAIPANRDAGDSVFTLSPGAFVQTQGGDITISRGDFGGTLEGIVELTGGSLTAAGGDIQIFGTGYAVGVNVIGVSIGLGSQVTTTGAGNITIAATGGANATLCHGVVITDAGTTVSVVDGALGVTGNTLGTGATNFGINISNGALVEATGNGGITFLNTSVTGTDSCYGIYVADAGTTVQTVDGPISFTGRSDAIGTNNAGITLESSSLVQSTGSGSILFNGTGGQGASSSSNGARIVTGASLITNTGTMFLTGTGRGTLAQNQGFTVSGSITTTDGGITIQGVGGDGTSFNAGVLIGGPITSNSTTMFNDINITGVGGSLAGSSLNVGIGMQAPGAVIATNSAAISMTGTGGNDASTNSTGFFALSGAITSNTGDIVLRGTGGTTDTGSSRGISLTGGTTVTSTGGGAISLRGDAGSGTGLGVSVDNEGVQVTGLGTQVLSQLATVTIIGNGGLAQVTTGNRGININTSAQVTGRTGLVLTGTASAFGTDNNVGVLIDTTGAVNASVGSSVITGIGNGSGNQNYGVAILGGSSATIIGAGTMDIIGTSNAAAGSQNHGVFIQGTASVNNGNMTVTATPGAAEPTACLIDSTGTISSSGAGSIQVTTTQRDCLINNGGSVVETGTGSITVTAARDLNIVAGAASDAQINILNGGSASPILLIAGRDISMVSTPGGVARVSHTGTGNVTLVVDNDFPVSPGIGPGAFFFSSEILGNGEIRIYTARRSQNTINDLINGSAFIPGPFGIDTSSEKWMVYYAAGAYGGGPFTIYYKEPDALPTASTAFFNSVERLLVNEAQLTDLLPQLPSSIYPHYVLQFCQQDKNRVRRCTKNILDEFLEKPFYRN